KKIKEPIDELIELAAVGDYLGASEKYKKRVKELLESLDSMTCQETACGLKRFPTLLGNCFYMLNGGGEGECRLTDEGRKKYECMIGETYADMNSFIKEKLMVE
ncbi:hypothetical protein KJ855_04185, partial [Patescibacteria group bacterium]|nr:hypothetical protein [Patescibacteria group bacterium]